MPTIQIPQKHFQAMANLYKSFYEIYGGKDAVWELDDLDEMRQIGQEFMEIIAINNPANFVLKRQDVRFYPSPLFARLAVD